MIKKIVLICFTAASFLFFSCNSTDVENPQTMDENSFVEAEADETLQNDITEEADLSVEENNINNETSEPEESLENEDSDLLNDESLSENVESEEAQKLLSEQFPFLEEIVEPEIIDVSIEDIIQQEIENQKKLEAEKAKENPVEEEKVSEIDILTPIEIIENESQTAKINNETTAQTSTEKTDSTEKESSSDLPKTVTETESTTVDEIEDIENTEETENLSEDENIEPEEVIVPSRSVTLRKGETLSVTYPGNGWIYMGSTDEYNNLASRGRKLGSTDTKYTLQAKEPGTQIHHFYKVDNLTGEYIDDYLEVIVLDKKGSSSTVVTAPEYKEIVPHKPEEPAKSTATKNKEKAEKEAAAQSNTSETVSSDKENKKEVTENKKTDTTPKTDSSKAKKQNTEVQNINNDDDVIFLDEEDDSEVIAIPDYDEATINQLFTDAKNNYKNKKYSEAFTQINNYLEFSTENRDEALYILAQIYENDIKLKDIKKAITTYQLLCDNYPASSYWDAANKRIIYLNRFYINIH